MEASAIGLEMVTRGLSHNSSPISRADMGAWKRMANDGNDGSEVADPIEAKIEYSDQASHQWLRRRQSFKTK